MQRKIIKITLLLTVSLVVFISCVPVDSSKLDAGANGSSSDYTETYGETKPMEIIAIADSKTKKIHQGMTMEEINAVLGVHHYDFQNVIYPFAYSWQMSNNRILTIVFKSDNCKDQNEFLDRLENGEVTGKAQKRHNTMTSEMLENARKWMNTHVKATDAYIEECVDGITVKTALFDHE